MKIKATTKEIIYGKFQSSISSIDSVVHEAKSDIPGNQVYSAKAVHSRACRIKDSLISDLTNLINSVEIESGSQQKNVENDSPIEKKLNEESASNGIKWYKTSDISVLEKIIESGNSSEYTAYVMRTNSEEFKSDILEILARQRQRIANLINDQNYSNIALNSKLIDE